MESNTYKLGVRYELSGGEHLMVVEVPTNEPLFNDGISRVTAAICTVHGWRSEDVTNINIKRLD